MAIVSIDLLNYNNRTSANLFNMDITTTLTEITADHVYPDLTQLQKREIDRRIDEYELNPENTLTWEEVKASIQNS